MAESDPRFAEVIARLHRLHNADSNEVTLTKLADLAVLAVDGCDISGVMLNTDGRLTTDACTDDLVRDLDDAQYAVDDGPCVRALGQRESTRIDDTATDERWPEFTSAARNHQVLSSCSVPLVVDGETLGVLNLYSRRAGAFRGSEAAAQEYGAHAALALSNANRLRASVELTSQLEQALASRAAIEQAKGILMAQMVITAEDAFDELIRRSQIANRKLRDVANDIVGEASTQAGLKHR
jgi:GAF domain-containing protein